MTEASGPRHGPLTAPKHEQPGSPPLPGRPLPVTTRSAPNIPCHDLSPNRTHVSGGPLPARTLRKPHPCHRDEPDRHAGTFRVTHRGRPNPCGGGSRSPGGGVSGWPVYEPLRGSHEQDTKQGLTRHAHRNGRP